MSYILDFLIDLGIQKKMASYLATIITIAGIALICMLANWLTKKVVLRVITPYVGKSKLQWRRFLLERRVIHKLSHIVPAIIIYYFSFSFPTYQHLIAKGVMIYMVVVMLIVFDALLDMLNDVYTTYDISKMRPIRGYIQVVKIVVFIVGGILVISNLIGESPLILLSGIGALSAVVMLIFKDSILGLVAGVQLTSNDMVRVGDWISMPKYGADGDVLDISLNTVKVQNWDKTITTIPTYALISDSFINWRGMQASGGRRIKRSVHIDAASIGFCTPEMLEKFKGIHLLSDYILDKEREIRHYNEEHEIDTANRVNGRALTNIGVFRAYLQRYIEEHPKVHKGLTRMVRQLEPGEHGLPLEIYAFSNDTAWAVYEGLQSDIFDHIFAVAPEFGLRIFQSPSGADMRGMLQGERSSANQ
ncbi:mechanosensitive ion channel family protein [Paenibacillus sp. PAMC21692]|uniref:mechanosensitive ion channel family protein n=1 Tax=Paenibacillus sp. PAMC21692 TaxID=2762320 RepID=UPI00164E3103|nr:mechanosensitive ion channel domain-containing protein [Paenibacillus sp. PAMC21692]QNK58924.1 mechanosensitive ion channel [Paenibacillus sp. PAMC21692]